MGSNSAQRILDLPFLVDFFNRLKTVLPIEMDTKAPSNPLTGYKAAQYRGWELHAAPIHRGGMNMLGTPLVPAPILIG